MTTKLDAALWIAGFLGNSFLFSIMLYKREGRRFPVFTLLAGYESVRTIALFLISRTGNHSTYALAYWTSEFADILIQVALLVELSKALVRSPHGTERSLVRQLLSGRWPVIACIVACLCALSLPVTESTPATLDMRACLFTSLLTCQVYLMILTRVNRQGLEKNWQAMAIGNGVAMWSVCVVISDLIHQLRGWQNQAKYFEEFRSFVVVAMLLYWCVVFSRSVAGEQRESKRLLRTGVDTHACAGKVGS